jgi:hypothetical protein
MPLCLCIMDFLSALRSSFHHGFDLAPGLFDGILAIAALVIASVSSARTVLYLKIYEFVEY